MKFTRIEGREQHVVGSQEYKLKLALKKARLKKI